MKTRIIGMLDIKGLEMSRRVYDKNYLAPTINTCGGGNREPKTMENNENVRIRRLTPKECWRLMGFTDEDYEKASKVSSNTSLYRQAGNSIVVQCLMAIFKEML